MKAPEKPYFRSRLGDVGGQGLATPFFLNVAVSNISVWLSMAPPHVLGLLGPTAKALVL